MDYRILELFMKENDAWEDQIRRHREEMPLLDEMISKIVKDKTGDEEERQKVFHHLHDEVAKTEASMEELEHELVKQQEYLSAQRRRVSGDPYSIDTFNSQNILRNRIRDVEKHFVELKCNYLNYLATI